MADQQRVKSYHSCDALTVVGFSFGLLLGVVWQLSVYRIRLDVDWLKNNDELLFK